ncbi:MAG: TetR/AcrR family transcriptional regulator [Bryobacteraceae bacterium]
MRYRAEHKSKIHSTIVSDASRRFRSEGLSGAGVASVMRDAGLTHGGFYKHFANKNELLAEAAAEAFRETAARLLRAAARRPSVEPWKSMVTEYLSMRHCDHPERGCPLAALAPELARAHPATKKNDRRAHASPPGHAAPLHAGRDYDAARTRFLSDLFHDDRRG